MARLNIHIATDAKGPSKQRVIGMYVLECIVDGKLETKEGTLIRENATGQELTLMLMINTLHMVKRILERTQTEYESISIYTNAKIVETAMLSRWIDTWEENAWKTVKGKEVANSELWQQAIELIKECSERVIFPGKKEFDTSIISRESSYLSWLELQINGKKKEIENQEKVDSMISKFKEKMDNGK